MATTRARTPSERTGSAPSRRCWSSATGSATSVREAPRAEMEQLLRVHPESYVQSVRDHCERGAAFDLDTPTSAGSWEAALRAAGAACALVEALARGPRAHGVLRAAPARPPRRARACDGLLPVRQRGRRRAPRPRLRSAASACWCSTGTCTTATARRRSSTPAPRSCSRASTSGRSGPAPARSRTQGRAPARASRSTCRCPRAPGRRSGSGLWSTWPCRRRGPSRPTWCWCRPASTPTATTRSRSAGWRRRASRTWPVTCARWPTASGVPAGAVLEGGYDVDALAASVAATMEALARGGEPRSVTPGVAGPSPGGRRRPASGPSVSA